MYNRPKIGLALGSGASRGIAHFGVIKVLKEKNIPIDFVSGSSMGAVIGALFCSGIDLELAVKILKHMEINHVVDFSVSKKGLIKGKKIEELLRLFIKPRTFEELKIPLAVVATDLKTGKRVVFDKGDLHTALRASISIPGVFTPVKFKNTMLIDGGVIDRMPSGVARKMGADIVVGVDVNTRFNDEYSPRNIVDIIIQSISIMEMQILKRRIEKCDVLITPQVAHLNPFSLEKIDEAVNFGVLAAREKVSEIKELLVGKACIIKGG